MHAEAGSDIGMSGRPRLSTRARTAAERSGAASEALVLVREAGLENLAWDTLQFERVLVYPIGFQSVSLRTKLIMTHGESPIREKNESRDRESIGSRCMMVNPIQEFGSGSSSRRRFLRDAGAGLGAVALAWMLGEESGASAGRVRISRPGPSASCRSSPAAE